eukprot:TRINITY_DN107596_c0_g1_i1.p1 TRINITY_DN107596_c0_g1~~TRINITY_DN107596_c0_g1_i1.p1  ORF type:complete len:371 (+),score=91.56 TRINITY_DN107596_c0_g1_i1:92-1114(+)
MSHFQVRLGHHWQDYEAKEDKKLKTAYMSGKKTARFNMTIRGKKEKYEVDFGAMTQTNLVSHGDRDIRPPYGLKAPDGPVTNADGEPMTPGPTMCIKVPEGAPGQTIQVPHPKAKGKFFEVRVPAAARPGQAMLVPIPPWEGKLDAARAQFKKWDSNGDGVLSFAEMSQLIQNLNPDISPADVNAVMMSFDANGDFQIDYNEFLAFLESPHGGKGGGGGGGGGGPAPAPAPAADPAADPAAEPAADDGGKKAGWSTGAKVATGVAVAGGVAVIAGAAVAGALLAEGDGLEDLGDALGDIAADAGEFFGDAGEAIADVAGDAGEAIGDVAEDAGDFIMDLF